MSADHPSRLTLTKIFKKADKMSSKLVNPSSGFSECYRGERWNWKRGKRKRKRKRKRKSTMHVWDSGHSYPLGTPIEKSSEKGLAGSTDPSAPIKPPQNFSGLTMTPNRRESTPSKIVSKRRKANQLNLPWSSNSLEDPQPGLEEKQDCQRKEHWSRS